MVEWSVPRGFPAQRSNGYHIRSEVQKWSQTFGPHFMCIFFNALLINDYSQKLQITLNFESRLEQRIKSPETTGNVMVILSEWGN